MGRDSTAECVADVGALLGEGTVWVPREQALYWLDIEGRRIFRLDEDGKRSEWATPLRVGSLAPRAGGGFVAATENGFFAVDLDEGGFAPLVDPERDRPGNRFNDGKVDRSGRFWAGSMDDSEERASGALYRLDADLSWSREDDGFRVTNGPAFSPDDRSMYVNDSALRTTYVYRIAEDGSATDRRVFARFGKDGGYPDGMTVDAEGCLWIAFWDGWCLRRLSPAGEVLQKVELPVQRPTCPAFGGADLDRLYVSSARIDLDSDALLMQPCAGGLFLLQPGVNGIADRPFAG